MQRAGRRSLVGGACGPYRILAELGAGAMGTVYLAETETGERVALKLLHDHLLQRKGFFTRFRREAEAGRQVDHRNVVRTLDCDLLLVDGVLSYFLVMEYAEGQTLRQLLQELGRVPEGLLREIALQASAGLAAIHAEGIVHRDLKPENVLLAGDQRVRIMDLGLAKLEESSAAVTMAGRLAGSLLYVAPEQIRQEDAGPLSDLYSLGVLLHELAAGRNAFRRDSAAAVMYAHLHHEPLPVPDLSPFLAAVLETLLEKSPADRFGSAAALHRTLLAGEKSRWWQERREDSLRRAGGGVRIPVRRATKMVGRDAEQQDLREAWERAKRGAGAAVLVEGEAGIGKTRLVDAFVRSVAGEGAAVLYGSFPPSGEDDALADALRHFLRTDDLESELSWYLEATPTLLPAFAARLLRRPAPEGSSPLDRGALQTLWSNVLARLAAEQPVVWVVEDLQFAPAEARAVLRSMAREVEGRRALLLATARTGPPGEPVPEGFRRLPLRRLTRGEVMRLVDDAFRNRELSERLGGRIAQKSDGVPFFVCEMIRGLSERRFLKELPDGRFVEARAIDRIEVPSAVRDLIEARLQGLAPEERTVLDVAAVQGFEFDPALTAQVLRLEKVTVLQRIALLERRAGVVRGLERTCRFDHHLVQEVVYGGLLPALRAEYHTLVAEATAGAGPATGARAHAVALHHLRGADPARAFPFLDAAFEHLGREARSEAVIELAELATRRGLDGEVRVHAMLHEAAAWGLLGDPGRQRATLERARAEAAARGDRPLMLRALVAGHEGLDEALALARELGDPVAEARATVSLGMDACATGDLEGGRARLEEALAIARRSGDGESAALAATHLSDCLIRLACFEDARRHAREARAAMQEAGNRTGEIVASVHLARAQAALGDRYGARELAEQALVVSCAVGYRRGEALAAAELAEHLRRLGRFAEAAERCELALARAREVGDRALEARALGERGTYWQAVGRGARALDAFEQGLMIHRELGDRVGEQELLARRGFLLAAHGGPDTAGHAVEEAAEELRRLGARAMEAEALGHLGRIAELHGDAEEALRRYRALVDLRLRTGDREGAAEGSLWLGRVRGEAGPLERARALAEEIGMPWIAALARVFAAGAEGGGDLALQEERLSVPDRVDAHAALWRATGDGAHLAEARRLLLRMREQAPRGLEDALVRRIPPYAAIGLPKNS